MRPLKPVKPAKGVLMPASSLHRPASPYLSKLLPTGQKFKLFTSQKRDKRNKEPDVLSSPNNVDYNQLNSCPTAEVVSDKVDADGELRVTSWRGSSSRGTTRKGSIIE